MDIPQSPSDGSDKTQSNEKVRYDALIASIGEGLIITNNQGKITDFNKAAEEMLGWKQNEVVDKFLQEVVHMEYHNGRQASHTDNELNTLTIAQPLYFIRRDGTKFPVSIKVTSYVQGEELVGTITLFHDVTAQHNIDQMKTEFISLTSHQLKTPLAALRWYSEMLLSGDAGQLSDRQMQLVNNIHISMRRMNDLVNALLNISRIESGRLRVNPEQTDLKKLVAELLEEIKTKPDAKLRNIKLNVQDGLQSISVDQLIVRQVYMNLIINSIKYTPEGGEITISLYLKDDAIVSQISDNGFGIPGNDQKKVFDRFYRGENIVTKEISGNGLGLFLTKALVELSGGKIWYESQEGKGTSFYFSLPLAGTTAKEGVVTLDG